MPEEIVVTEEGGDSYLYIKTLVRDSEGRVIDRKIQHFSLLDAYEQIQQLTHEVAELKAHNERLTGDHK